jgi:hypothetical protein
MYSKSWIRFSIETNADPKLCFFVMNCKVRNDGFCVSCAWPGQGSWPASQWTGSARLLLHCHTFPLPPLLRPFQFPGLKVFVCTSTYIPPPRSVFEKIVLPVSVIWIFLFLNINRLSIGPLRNYYIFFDFGSNPRRLS